MNHPLRKKSVCAVRNVLTLKKWIMKQRENQLESTDAVDADDSDIHHEAMIFSQKPTEINENIFSMYS